MADTALKKFRQPLLGAVRELLAPHGFSLRRRDYLFEKPLPMGRGFLQLIFIPHGRLEFHVNCHVAVRFDAVEELVIDSQISKRERYTTATLGRELGNIRSGTPLRWVIAKADDVQVAARALVQVFCEAGLQYLQRYSDPEKALSILARNDVEGWHHMPLHELRCRRAIALALVLNKYESVDELIIQSEHFLHSRSDANFTTFIEFVDRVRALRQAFR